MVEKNFAPITAAHPLIRRSIIFNLKGWRTIWSQIRNLRREKYDLIFDLQGNCKSGVITALARGGVKIGFDRRSVREWPNILATHVRFYTGGQNIRLQYLSLVRQYFQDSLSTEIEGVRFSVDEEEKRAVEGLSDYRIMVCPGSKWINKQLPLEAWIGFLKRVEGSFLFVWGDEKEREFCEKIKESLPQKSALAGKLSIPAWQNLMSGMDLVIAVDSSALHLCATTNTASFSIFGPSNAEVFKPLGERHFALQGPCPYGRTFKKTCPVLRSCPTGACIRALSGERIFESFDKWRRRKG